MKVPAAGILLAFVAGCAGTATPPAPPQQVAAAPASAGSAPEQVCHKERPTGSLVLVTVCEPVVSEAERDRQMNEMRNTIRMQGAPRAPGP